MEHPSLDRVQHLGDQPEEPEVGSAVFTERQRPDGAMALVVFDVLHLDGRSVMREAWRDRRKRLEDLVEGRQLPRTAGEHKGCSPRPEPRGSDLNRRPLGYEPSELPGCSTPRWRRSL